MNSRAQLARRVGAVVMAATDAIPGPVLLVLAGVFGGLGLSSTPTTEAV